MRRKHFWEGYRLATEQAISLAYLVYKQSGESYEAKLLVESLKQQLNGSRLIEREERNE